MEGIYKYLIGGKRTGKRNIPTFNELCVGDAFYIYEYKKFYGKKPNEYIRRCKIETIHKNVQSSLICFNFCGDINSYIQYTQYVSQAVCAKELNICAKVLSWRLRKGADRVWGGRYTFEVIKGETSLKEYQSEPKKVVIRNNYNGEVVHFDSLRKASEFLNIKYDALKKRVSRNSTVFGDWELKAYNPRLGEECPVF